MAENCQLAVSSVNYLRHDQGMRIRKPPLARNNGVRLKSDRIARKANAQAQSSKFPVPAFRLTRIVVPIDFTRESTKPLAYASALAEAHGGRILLLHVAPPIKLCVDCGYGPVNREAPDEAQMHRDRLSLRQFARRHLRSELVENILIRSGAAPEEIITTAREHKADLIILCAHEQTDPESIYSRTTMEKVTRFAPCPVLVVRSHEQDFI
jgi:nucleotide-binding universal stress UspA family protein